MVLIRRRYQLVEHKNQEYKLSDLVSINFSKLSNKTAELVFYNLNDSLVVKFRGMQNRRKFYNCIHRILPKPAILTEVLEKSKVDHTMILDTCIGTWKVCQLLHITSEENSIPMFEFHTQPLQIPFPKGTDILIDRFASWLPKDKDLYVIGCQNIRYPVPPRDKHIVDDAYTAPEHFLFMLLTYLGPDYREITHSVADDSSTLIVAIVRKSLRPFVSHATVSTVRQKITKKPVDTSIPAAPLTPGQKLRKGFMALKTNFNQVLLPKLRAVMFALHLPRRIFWF